MPPPSVGQLLDLLRESNLLSPDQWTDLRRLVLSPAVSRRFARRDPAKGPAEPAAPGLSPESLVDWLIKRGWITRWQGDMLLLGRTPVLGRYRLLECIGSGGMGAVFKAWHGGTGRVVALKVMADALVQNSRAIARFHKEIQAVAALNHPNIVSAYDADCVQRMHFLVMEYVDGHDLGWYLTNTRSLPAGWVCEVIRQAALGLHHAHERGMIHRDVKPTNLLVARDPETAGPLVKVLDLGLARFAAEVEEAENAPPSKITDSGLTQAGQVLGTPDYMSPEQALDTRRADVRSDIFSLGCTLFRLLTHEYPFPGESVVEKIESRQKAPARRLRDLSPDLPSGLDAVLARMLALDPGQRYQSALEVAFALAPFSDPQAPPPRTAGESRAAGEASSSGRLSFGDDPRLREFFANLPTHGDADAPTRVTPRLPVPAWSRKTWLSIAGGTAAVLALLSLWFWVGQVTLVVDWPSEDRKEATLTINGRPIDLLSNALFLTGRSGKWELQLTRAGYEPIRESLNMTFGEHRSYAPHWRPTPKTARQQELALLRKRGDGLKISAPTEASLIQLRQELIQYRCRYASSEEAGLAARLLASLPSPLDGLRREQIPDRDLRLAGFGDVRYAPEQLVGIVGDGIWRFWNRVLSLSISPDGRWIAAASLDGTVRIYDRQAPEELQILRLSNEPREVQFNPADASLAIVGSRREITFWRKQGSSWELDHTLRGLEAPLAFSRDGRIVAAHGRRNEIVICDSADGRQVRTVQLPPRVLVSRIALNQDGRLLCAECRDDSLFIWKLAENGTPFHIPKAQAPAFDPEGKQLAAGGLDGDLRIWNADSGTLERTLELGGTPIGFSADGMSLVSYRNGRVAVWDTQTGAALRTIVDVPALVKLSRSGENLLAASESVADLRIWNLKSNTPPLTASVEAPITTAAWLPDESRIVTADVDFGLREWDPSTGQEVRGPATARGPVAAHPEGTPIALAVAGTIQLQDLPQADRALPALQGSISDLSLLAWSPDGRWIAGAGGPGFFGATLHLWDAVRGREIPLEAGQPGPIRAMAFTSTGLRLATAGETTVVALWDLSRRTVQETFDLFPARIHSLAFDRSRRWLAGAARDGRLFAWDLSSRAGVTFDNSSRVALYDVSIAPGGKRLATASDAGIILWDVESGQRLRTLSCRPTGALCLAFSPTGERLAAAGPSGTLWLWDWPANGLPGEEPDATLAIGPAGGLIRQIFWSTDDRHLLTVNGNSTIYVLRLPREKP